MENSNDVSHAVLAIGRIDALPTLLQVLCDITGMRVAMVAHVASSGWTVSAVRDRLNLGITPTAPLALEINLDVDSSASRAPILIERASSDPRIRRSDRPDAYQVESYVSVPIFLSDGRYFGVLCAFDPLPSSLGPSFIMPTFNHFATLIASQLSQLLQREREQTALFDERAAGELREQFMAILGHDLRNPLQAAFASSDVLLRKLADPALAALATRIKTNIRRMSLLIDDVLDFARARLGGGIDMDLADVANINSGLMTVIQEVQDAQPDSKILSSISVNRAVRCDLGRLQQVATNLLVNALTHGAPSRPIEISARDDETDLVLEVWNAGEPIPAESLGKIFEPFWRHSVSASRDGLGLGLHICSQIVRAHHGRMSVTSTRENGTRFTARLPLSLPATLPSVSLAIVEAPQPSDRASIPGYGSLRHSADGCSLSAEGRPAPAEGRSPSGEQRTQACANSG